MSADAISQAYLELLTLKELRKSKKLTDPGYGLSHCYGKPAGKDLEVVNSWKNHIPTQVQSHRRDFRSMNRRVSDQDFRAFRHTQDSFVQQRRGSNSIAVVLPEESFSYGNPNKPSTPMDSLIGHKFGTQSALVTQDIYKGRLSQSQQRQRYVPKITRTAQLVQETTSKKLLEMEKEPFQPTFKLKKFQNVKNKVDTINRGYSPLRTSCQDSNARSVSFDIGRAKRTVV